MAETKPEIKETQKSEPKTDTTAVNGAKDASKTDAAAKVNGSAGDDKKVDSVEKKEAGLSTDVSPNDNKAAPEQEEEDDQIDTGKADPVEKDEEAQDVEKGNDDNDFNPEGDEDEDDDSFDSDFDKEDPEDVLAQPGDDEDFDL